MQLSNLFLTEIAMRVREPCKTPGAVYHTHVGSKEITITVDIPKDMQDAAKSLSEQEIRQMENQIHDALEEILERIWKK